MEDGCGREVGGVLHWLWPRPLSRMEETGVEESVCVCVCGGTHINNCLNLLLRK